MRQVRKKRANADLTDSNEMTCEETNNNTSTYNNYIPTSYNESLFQTRNLNDEHHITRQNCDNGNPRNHKDKSSVSTSNLERLKAINSNGEQTLQHTSIPSRQLHTSSEYSDVFDSNSYSNNTHNIQSVQTEPNIWIHDTATVQDTNTDWFQQRTEQHVPFPSHLRNMIISLNLEE
ncbi:uncharacterized protein LOC132717797 [Ruditapes philippinarum]|uniref:uncharacterized protein LOC132717797 n=1 Tax=Ruditapes philippinarum TaxID=129788 RepID=UPI00295AC4D3|nr:uncharacterized protein LOC132717797 [Ruditapes philippinarum]